MTDHDSPGYDRVDLLRMPPLSVRRHPPALPGLLLDLVDFSRQARAEPFRGVTSDGSIRPGLFR